MRRIPVLLALAAVVLVGAFALGRLSAATGAQEGTPPAGEEGLEGVAFEPLAFGTAEELPAAPAGLALFRVTLDPGAALPIEADDPSVGLVYVGAGALVLRIEAPVRVLRGAAVAAAMATPEGGEPAFEEVAAGTEFTLEAGDSALIPANVAGEVRNDGDAPAVGLGAIVEPGPGGDEATPVG